MKPANVMLVQHKNDADFVKLLDFGIAEIEGQGPGGGLGTPTYLSPEQARGAAPDARSDLYSLGALLYEMVGGRPPFVAPNPMAVLSAHLHEEPAPLASLCPEVSPAFAAVVHRALAKRAEDRFESADAMRVALHDAGVRGEPAAAEEPGAQAEITGELEIARRVDFPSDAPSARKDPRRALLPGALALGIALAVLFAASRFHRELPTEVDEREPNDAPAATADAAPVRRLVGAGATEPDRRRRRGAGPRRPGRRGRLRRRAPSPRPGPGRGADRPAAGTGPGGGDLARRRRRPGTPRPGPWTSSRSCGATRAIPSWRGCPSPPPPSRRFFSA